MCVPTLSSSTYPCMAALVNVSRPPYDTFQSHAAYTPPKNFTRVLYIPRHDSSTPHLPLYDVAKQYHESAAGAVFGSYLQSVKLSYMEKPRGDDMTSRVEYLVDRKDRPEKASGLQVRRRTLDVDHDAMVHVSVPSWTTSEYRLGTGRSSESSMIASFPIAPSIRGEYRIPHPYFTFRLPAQANQPERTLQWQVHPGPNSLFRYTLVDIGCRSVEKGPGPSILAIYIHVGIVVWMPVEFSQGVLLLPEDGDREEEAMVVASLLAMLHQMREDGQMRPRRHAHHSPSSTLGKMASKLRLR
ncbi:hypothetical protein BDV25DRAFT_149855 [Aspergillus avenaceus]|uniref:Uncharacterized protein n=1 Tax=Aspergillus avenaceus TaxID=36643 RepID=A0A5N6U3K6_ASPAV|nr:hypothetical protein BDV25DRAFT_149855 [Aspergillus avenaceus]